MTFLNRFLYSRTNRHGVLAGISCPTVRNGRQKVCVRIDTSRFEISQLLLSHRDGNGKEAVSESLTATASPPRTDTHISILIYVATKCNVKASSFNACVMCIMC